MNANDGAHVSCKVTTTSRDGEILCRIETVGIDHEISVILVYLRCFGAIFVIEEFWECLFFNFMN